MSGVGEGLRELLGSTGEAGSISVVAAVREYYLGAPTVAGTSIEVAEHIA